MPRIQADTVAEHKRMIRRRLLDAAMDVFADLGYEQTTFAELAAEAGVGRTTIYEYFRDKEDLLATLVEEELPATFEAMLAALPDGVPTITRLEALVRALVEFVATDPTLGYLLHREVPKLSGEAQRRAEAAHVALVGEFIGLLRAGVAEGSLRPLPLDVMGRLLQDCIMSGSKILIQAPNPSDRLGEVTDTVVEFVFAGIATTR
ncbi:MAG: TetR/AcrR family transcriptional regulator [Acidimicrobiia bacterium]